MSNQTPDATAARDNRREAILDAAEAVFLDVGFSAASMSMIAARVGGSKGTLYNYFKSKDELFAAYIDRHCVWQQQGMADLLSGEGDLEATLRGVGESLLRITTSDFALRNFVLVSSEAHRAPQLGRTFYAAGPARGVRQLIDFIGREMDAGRLRADDPEVAAHQFVGLCQHRLFKARLCNAAPEPTDAEVEQEAARATTTFLAAYRVAPRAG